MNPTDKWRMFLKSGSFHRKVNKYRNVESIQEFNINSSSDSTLMPSFTVKEHHGESCSYQLIDVSLGLGKQNDSEEIPGSELEYYSPDDEDLDSDGNNLEFEESFQGEIHKENADDTPETLTLFLRKWCMEYNISQQALKPLLFRLKIYDKDLPEDPRRLLRTPRSSPTLINIGGGQYWHQGFEPTAIKINVNIDGLPLFKKGTNLIWPILFNIHERPDIKPMIIGIFYGRNKPNKVEEFLNSFVSEIQPILESGININGSRINVEIRAFLCDSPARAFVKGTVNYNSLHGCLKCCTIGQHSSLLRTNIFPQTVAPKRTDADFREGVYNNHYQVYKVLENGKLRKIAVVTPLLQLPIDIIEDVIVSDSLHLLYLGAMKRLLLSYKDGHNGLEDNKWSKTKIDSISNVLKTVKLPIEIHRAVRGMEYLSHWKASECASFLHYIGIVLLKYFISEDHFQNFANLFCAVTICSTDYYKRFLSVAQKLFEEFIKQYYMQFNSMTSNIHNLVHVVDEVTRFGSLPSISSYPFENHLFQIKKMVRSGKLPLHQIINRMMEKNSFNRLSTESIVNYPILKKLSKTAASKFFNIELSKGFELNNGFYDKWFLTKQAEIVDLDFADSNGIHFAKLLCFNDLFTTPLASSLLSVYKAKDSSNLDKIRMYPINQILCKLVPVSVYEETAFIPLLHTFLIGVYL